MKQSTYLLIILALTSGLLGCKKFLNTKPSDNLSPEQYYNTSDKLVKALAGVYDRLVTTPLYGDYLFSEWDAGTDDSYFARSGTTTGIQVYNFDFANPRPALLWTDCYTGIQRANQLIASIDLPDMDEVQRANILAEAKFLRGYFYFMLVQRFGGVPLRLDPTTSPNNLDLERAPLADVYKQILKDMTEAEAGLLTATQVGYSSRVFKTTAQGILARVCMHMAGQPLNDKSKYADALAWAKKVKESGEHTLNTSFNSALTNSAYSQVFINHSQDIYDIRESMWEADFKGNKRDGYNELGRVGNTIGLAMTTTKFNADTGYSYGFVKATGRLFKLYGAGDQRRDWALQTYSYNATTGQRVPISTTASNMYSRDATKWKRSYELATPKDQNWGPTNFPILRYADVLLMLAEAENQVNGPTDVAYEALNMVRRRAYGVPYSIPDPVADAPAGMSKDDFQLFIEDERSRELCFEALRRQDLVRWGKLITNLRAAGADQTTNGGGVAYGGLAGRNVTERHLLYPIPANEIALNKKMVQNPGW